MTSHPISRPRKGLTADEAVASRMAHGDNLITPPRDDSVWRLFVDKFRDPIIGILLAAALVSLPVAFFDGDFKETIGIVCAVVLATCVGFVFEWDAMRRFKRLNRVNDDVPVKVLRDGAMGEIPRREVVVGDLVWVEAGETVPADGRLFEAQSLRVDESTLTGESETGKTVDPAAFDPDAAYPSDCLLRGTTVRDGSGAMVVTAVGDATEAGRVTEQSTVESGEPTPLNRQLIRLSRQIGRIGIALSVLVFVVLAVKAFWLEGAASQGWLHAARTVLDLFMISVAMIAMAVPEGLPMSITLSLALSMRRMLRTNNLVRRMHACETMGAVTVICTDKTGTLTRNRMTVTRMIVCDPEAETLLPAAIAVNSTAFLDAEGRAIGNPTEGALLSWLKDRGGDYEALRAGARIVDRLTFSAERKYMATLAGMSGRRLLFVKGAPEIVLAHCGSDASAGRIRTELRELQGRGMRTLAVAWAECTGSAIDLEATPLRLGAVAAIADPVRAEVPAAVAECLAAGIAVKIVTGDTPVTACEIARRIGLWDDAVDGDRQRMTGAEFAAASDEELLGRVGELKILSRARPLDKQRLVRLLQRQGEVVAATGDGTNDAPALRFADVGLSMGSGTSVAKDASDITLLDDSFSSIVMAVMWGRSLYRNIQRFILFQLTINFVAIAIFLVGSVAGHDMPLTVTQILWVNIIMDTLAAMAMASLPPSREVMAERPRDSTESIVSGAMARTILVCGSVFIAVLLGMLFYWQSREGTLSLEHLTVFFTTFVLMQMWNLFNARGFEYGRSVLCGLSGCRTFLFVALSILLTQVAIVEVGGEVFRTVPLDGGVWLRLVGATSWIAVGGEIVRAIRRRANRRC